MNFDPAHPLRPMRHKPGVSAASASLQLQGNVMLNLLESLANRLSTEWKLRKRMEKLSHAYRCRCGTAIFFPNTQCLKCQSQLGFVPDTLSLVALDVGPEPGTLRAEGKDRPYKYCGNRAMPALCNWLLDAGDPATLCIACRLNRTIPNLEDADNVRYWAAIEVAKRRLVAQLLAFGLPVRSKVDEDAERGLMFDFLRAPLEGPAVLTGHADGLITLNVEEADDVKREKIKNDLHEPYRTLLGHLRHEVCHYYWDVLVRDTTWLEPFRQLFGDERASYAEVLKRNYEVGPLADWADSYISSYATMHPWEDFAETFATYLDMASVLDTALHMCVAESCDPTSADLPTMISRYMSLGIVLNEMNRAMGLIDLVPEILLPPIVTKMQFVHDLVRAAAK